MSGWSWDPVVQTLQHYHCVVPDLPQYGRSFEQGPFEMAGAARAVAEVIRSRVATGRAHLVGFSLGAQVALQLMTTEPQLVERAILTGTFINTLPAVAVTRKVVRVTARTAWIRWLAINRHWYRHSMPPSSQTDDYIQDARLNSGAHLAYIAEASAGFTIPDGLHAVQAPTLFLSGGRENRVVHRWAANLAHSMPNAVNRVVDGMRHDWPVREPELFASTVDGWLQQHGYPRTFL